MAPVQSAKREKFVKKFDGGRRTPQEYHAQYAFPPWATCAGCKGKPAIRGIVLCPFDEACRRGLLPPAIVTPDKAMQALVMLKDGTTEKPYIRISVAYSCNTCRKVFEQTLAKAPSWCVVEINRGPDPHNRISVGV